MLFLLRAVAPASCNPSLAIRLRTRLLRALVHAPERGTGRTEVAVISGGPESARSLCELVSGMCEPSRLSLGPKTEKAIRQGETGRVSVAWARSQESQRLGKSLR